MSEQAESRRDVWVCSMVSLGDLRSASVDFGGAGDFDTLVSELRANRGDVWDCLYRFACLTRIYAGVYPVGANPEEERWFRLVCPTHYGADDMDAVPCERPTAELPPRFVWAMHHMGHTIDGDPPGAHDMTYDIAKRHRDAWAEERKARDGNG